jgi:AcrR family transcriptional regulator
MTRLPTSARRAQLIELGIRLFAAQAYEEVSIDRIADDAGISRGLLYHYFGGKRSFYVACLEVAAARLVEATAPAQDGDPARRARAGLEGWLDYVEDRAPAFLALMGGGVGTDTEVSAILERTRVALADRVLAELGEAAARPRWRMAVRAWIGATERCTIDWLTARDLPRDALLDGLVDLLGASLTLAAQADPVQPAPPPTDAPLEVS